MLRISTWTWSKHQEHFALLYSRDYRGSGPSVDWGCGAPVSFPSVAGWGCGAPVSSPSVGGCGAPAARWGCGALAISPSVGGWDCGSPVAWWGCWACFFCSLVECVSPLPPFLRHLNSFFHEKQPMLLARGSPEDIRSFSLSNARSLLSSSRHSTTANGSMEISLSASARSPCFLSSSGLGKTTEKRPRLLEELHSWLGSGSWGPPKNFVLRRLWTH